MMIDNFVSASQVYGVPEVPMIGAGTIGTSHMGLFKLRVQFDGIALSAGVGGGFFDSKPSQVR